MIFQPNRTPLFLFSSLLITSCANEPKSLDSVADLPSIEEGPSEDAEEDSYPATDSGTPDDNDSGTDCGDDENSGQQPSDEDDGTDEDTDSDEGSTSDESEEESSGDIDDTESDEDTESTSDGDGPIDGTITVSSSDLPLTIPSSGTSGVRVIESEPSPSGTVIDVNVSIDVEHTCTKDLTFVLQSPSGTAVTFMDLTSLVVCSSDLVGTKLDDEATVVVVDGSTPFSGRYRPTASLSVFDGEDAGGEWTLFIEDNMIGDAGWLNHWALEITVD